MKKCIICSKELDGNTEKFCNCCIEFFKWKYGKSYLNNLKRFEKILKSSLTKLNTGGKK